jgi:metal-responsive CopG/Arc/MetJ family transcriptional regulator
LTMSVTRRIRVSEYHREAMKTVKTAISISEPTYLQAEEMARRLGMNRSQLISAALAEFLERHREDNITEKLNEVYEGEESGMDPVLAKMQISGLPCERW